MLQKQLIPEHKMKILPPSIAEARTSPLMNKKIKKDLTCTICNEIKETYSEIVYSQGDRVCIECKKGTQRADNAQFDLDMNRRINDGSHVT